MVERAESMVIQEALSEPLDSKEDSHYLRSLYPGNRNRYHEREVAYAYNKDKSSKDRLVRGSIRYLQSTQGCTGCFLVAPLALLPINMIIP